MNNNAHFPSMTLNQRNLRRIICFFFCALSKLTAQFYLPNDVDYGSPSDYGLAFDEVHFTSADGTSLYAWHVKAKGEKRGMIIHFHGNAANISANVFSVSWLAEQGFDLFMFDYRGYGKSEGAPTQEGVFQDCKAALAEATRLNGGVGNLILYGQSLGAANAIALAGELKGNGFVGVIAEAPFYSYTSIAKTKVNAIAGALVEAMISDEHSPYFVVADIAPTPLLITHGKADRVIPYTHSKRLFAEAGQPKELWLVEDAGHMHFFTEERAAWREQLVAVMGEWLAQPPSSRDNSR
ncbi:alpha/beta hydrolase [Cerasicoccus arenae]|uniref:Serine aminopeptidase S33 domain-containing protein n=1 Tax=Cerasicoccus arenae TaxID=424488 RepID=A0A8J3GBZ6_9BACT|nr:alpha/beta hydrolase [Cerasicoccus arenae]MBK1858327.1 alpha/beta hydrolase [Cerasicoccus arenae]GHB90798.1 hypothetical protein GCM10007047_02030 [Cerasicoccus arenae]